MRKFNRMLAAILAAALLAGTWVTPLQAEGENTTEEATREETLPDETVTEETTSEEITTEEFETSEPATAETETEELTTEETTEEISEEMTEDSTEASLEDTSVLDYSKENGILRKDLEERLAEAKLALQEEVNQKDIYALIYLADYYAVKDAPSAKAATVADLPSAHTVQIIGMDVDWSTAGDDEYITTLPTVYFEVRFYMGETQATGYVEEKNLAYSDEILLEWKNEYRDIFKLPQASLYSVGLYSETMAADYTDVLQFPTSYQGYLNKLKEEHPNWTFVPMNTGRDFNSCVKEQYGNYSWIYRTAPDSFKGGQINTNWYYATTEAIAYYMDPRNFLTVDNIFQFEQNTYNKSYHTEAALKSFLANTFMKGALEDDSSKTYSSVIFNSGKSRGLSPYNLAARIVQEQGVNGTSAMISGKYAGYEGYYNYYNISASGTTNAEVLKNGLSYAKSQGWNTREKSLNGGAAFIGNGYILKGQDTLYLQKFDLEKRSGYLHQYMQNVQAAYSEGRSMKTMYNNANCLNSAFVFKIPVFTNMPGVEYTISPKTLKLEKGKTKSLTIKGNGMTIGNSSFKFTSSDTSVATVDANGVITAVDKGNAVITAVGGNDTNNVKLTCAVSVYIPLQSISLNATEETLYRGDTADATHPQTLTLQVSYTPADTTDDKTVTWTTSNKNVATVKKNENDSATAIVTAVGEGTAKITAKVGTNHTAVCTVTVKVPMQSAALNKTELTLFEGKQEKLTVSYLPMDTTDDTDVVWTSENPEVASVINGTVTAKMPGTTVVHAKIGPFDGSQQELSCTVTVEQCSVTFTNETGTAVLLQEFLSYGKALGTLQSDFPWNMESEGNRIFSGWYTKPDGGGTKVTKDTVVYSDMTLYPYYQENDRGFFVKPIGDMTYTGSAIKPAIEVYDKETLLIPGKDYTVSYKNNTKVNDASVEKTAPQVVVKGKGSYSGTQTVTFKIIQKDISEEDITADDLLTKYNGKTQKLAPVVKRNGKTLKKGTDYTVTYLASGTGSYLRAGSYAVLITGINGYTGERIIHIKITPKNLISKASVSAIKNQPYNGTTLVPPLTIRYSGKTLTKDVDYTAEYSNNTEIGTAQIVITGIGNYIGTKKVTFKITGTAISKAKISGIVSKEYTGETITQDYTITDSKGNPLTEGIHYTLQYTNNVNAGTATMLFTGIGSYSGTVKKTFKIMPYNIKNNTQTYEEQPAFLIDDKELSVPYEKGGAKPPVSVSYKDNALTEKTDYTLSYKNNTAVNDGSNEKKLATITIKGKGNFTGTVTKTFTITPKDISTVSISAADAVYRERKNAWKITPVLTDTNGKKLVAGTDYDRSFSYTYANDVMLSDGTYRHAGEEVQKDDIPMPGELNDAKITVTVQGIKNYEKGISATYRIVPQSIANASVKIPTQYYIGRDADGSVIPVTLSKDDIKVTISREDLKPSDFEIVSYSNNTTKGKAKVTIRGAGGYGGTKTITYTIAAKPIIWWKDITE